MRRLSVVTGLLLATCAMSGACQTAGPMEAEAVMSAQSESTLWLLPPAYEFAVADTGRLSLEIGLTPALLEIGSDSEQAVDPRAGVLMYPRGEMRGFALYAGVGRRGAEGGVWYVWRRDRGTLGTLDSFRVGIGFVTSADPDSVFPGQLGIGAAVGFSL